MSDMNFLERLLDGVAVEWKPLGEEFPFIRNGFVGTVTPFFTDAENGVRYLQGTNIHDGIISDDTTYYITKDFHQKCSRTELKADDILMVQSGHVGESAVVGEKYKGSNCHALIVMSNGGKCDSKFVNYYFQSTDGKKNLKRITTGGTVKHILASKMKQFIIPIPSLKIQAEIVRILDTFTALTAELTAELSDRQKQYNYYRDRLLTFEEGEVEWKTLGDLTLPTRNIRWKETDRSYCYIDLTSVSRENNSIIETSEITALNAPSRAQKLVEKDDVIFATTRPTQLRLCLINEEYSGEVASTGYCVLRAKAAEILPKWIYYHLSSLKFFNYVEENQSGSAYPAISDSKVKEFKLPVPSLEEQARIVAILDKFATLTTSISEGLPREIALRQKQYEYYRDLLLSFPPPLTPP